MKFLIMTVFSLCAGLCCREPENDNLITYRIENNTIMSVENNQNIFSINDDIHITSIIDYNQTSTNNEAINLNQIGASDLRTSIVLYKLTAYGTLSKIQLTENDITINAGDIIVNTNSEILNILFENDGNQYVNDFSIKLLDTGTYYLGSPNESFNTNSNYNINIYAMNYQNIDIHIFSSIINSNTDRLYEFTVN